MFNTSLQQFIDHAPLSFVINDGACRLILYDVLVSDMQCRTRPIVGCRPTPKAPLTPFTPTCKSVYTFTSERQPFTVTCKCRPESSSGLHHPYDYELIACGNSYRRRFVIAAHHAAEDKHTQ